MALAIVAFFSTFASAQARSGAQRDDEGARVGRSDNLPDPLTTRQLELKKQALEAKLNGKARGPKHEVARGQYVQLAREGEGAVWTVLGEFADLKHNSIPQPDRATDNTTIWVPDFSRPYFLDLLFKESPGANSMRKFYIEQSSGRYAVYGDVSDWIQAPKPAAEYNDDEDGGRWVWDFLQDTINGWYDAQIAAGKTPAQINAYLAQYDKWDRYDYDGDGNFDEPDGYIDTFQSVHAGEGEEAGAPAWTIWSHSWYAHYELQGSAGPEFNMLGGVQIGQSDYWVGKYTIQPENGGVGVFVHEFGHDLGLPDLYDTAGGDNGTGFWTLMSAGSWMDDGKDTIGNKSSHMGAWEKFQLGWLKYEVAQAGRKSEHKLGPMEFNTKQAQGVFVVLPKKGVTTNVGAPYAGSYYYYSGAGDRLDNLMSKPFTLPAGATLTAKVKYNIELDYDYAYLVYSTDNGANWTGIETNRSTTTDPNGQNKGHGITGSSGGAWVDLTANLPAGNVLLGFRYWTDTNTGGFGFMADDISITGQAVDGAEAAAGWTFKPATGFHVTNGMETAYYNHYYVAEYRTYKGYDSTLKVGPYNFGFLNNPQLGNWVEHFSYQDGLLINYWDTSQKNNQTRVHPGAGLLLPIDAHPKNLLRVDGLKWGNRIQTYDSTFTPQATDALTLHRNSVLSPVASQPGVSVFDDRKEYYDPANPMGSVKNPNTGTQIRIQSISAIDSFMQIEVRPVK
jgi:immune inhibitor A